jgi:hypothetical protein
MTYGETITLRLREILADLVGEYEDPTAGARRPAISYGELPPETIARGLEAHVDDRPAIRSRPGYAHELELERTWKVYLVAHDGTPSGALSSAAERVVAAFRTVSPAELGEDERLGIRQQVIVSIAE